MDLIERIHQRHQLEQRLTDAGILCDGGGVSMDPGLPWDIFVYPNGYGDDAAVVILRTEEQVNDFIALHGKPS